MPGYDKAIEDLKDNMAKEVEQKKKEKDNGTIKQDTK